MTDFTKSNLDAMDTREMGGVSGVFGRRQLGATQIGLSRFHFPPGERFPFGHRHKAQEEIYLVNAGSGRLKLDDEIHEVTAGDVVRVAPGVARGWEAGPDGLELIIAGGPVPEGGDGERVDDFWTD